MKARSFYFRIYFQKQINSSEEEKLINRVRYAGAMVRELTRTCSKASQVTLYSATHIMAGSIV